MGSQLRKSLVAREITSFAEKANLAEGDTVNRPYSTFLSVNTYVKGVDVTIQDIAPTNEQLVIDTAKEVSFYVDDIDALQNRYDIAKIKADEAAYLLRDAVDSSIFAEYANANLDLDDGDLGGTDGNAIAATDSNIDNIVTAMKRRLLAANVVGENLFLVVTPRIAEYMERFVAGNGFNTADATIRNGYAGNFFGVKIYVSNNLTTASSITHLLGGRMGAIDLVVQKEPTTLITQPEKKIGRNFINWILYGKKTFYEGARNLIDVKITSATAI